MSSYTLLSQAFLAATILASTVGTYIACSPPNPSPANVPPTNDLISSLSLTKKHSTNITLAPLFLVALNTCILVLSYPDISQVILGYGAENGLNTELITWSPATIIPLSLILFVGIPLRLISYASLGKNFTFALTKPDRLTTTGIHRHLQHPSYTGLMIIIVCNVALFGRADGVVSCWFPLKWMQILKAAEPTSVVVGLSLLAFGVWTRVKQEEYMLREEFGSEWETWHSKTPRFIPWLF